MEYLENKCCSNCNNFLCFSQSLEGSDALTCCGWYNDELVGRSKVLKITDINKLR